MNTNHPTVQLSNNPVIHSSDNPSIQLSGYPVLRWLALLVLLSILNPQLSTLHAQGTAFTYQGRLNDGGNPASGQLRFALHRL